MGQPPDVSNLKQQAQKLFWVIVIQVGMAVAVSAIPLLTIVLFIGIEIIAPFVPVVTLNPPGVSLYGDGIQITRILIGVSIVRIAQKLYSLEHNASPTLEVQAVSVEDD